MAHLATAALQGVVLLAAVALIIVLLWSQRLSAAKQPEPMDVLESSRSPLILAHQVATRDHFEPVPSSPEDVDTDRVKSVLRAGRTYEIRVKGGFTTALTERDDGVRRRENLAFVFEMVTRRTVESNDGRRIAAVVQFDEVRMVKLLSAVDAFEIDLGRPGAPLLDRLDHLAPDEGIAVVDVAPVAYAVLGRTAQPVAESPTSRAFLETDPLSGKTVRITYRTGLGMESIEPIGCALDNWQAQFVFRTALLSDYFLLPVEGAAAGKTWKVDGRQLLGYFDPSIRGVPEGPVAIRAGAEYQRDGKRYRALHVEGDALDVLSCIFWNRILGRFQPTGTVQFNLSDGHVEAAQLSWRIERPDFSEHGLLFETDFQGRPTLAIDYCCKPR